LSLESVEFSAAGQRVVVRSELPGVVEVLRASWEPALLESGRSVAMGAELEFRVETDGTVYQADHRLGRTRSPGNVASLMEGFVLERLALDNQVSFLLHAGAVVLGDHLILLLGEAGAGKSTFTREALRLGATYLTDDSLVCEPGNFRGLARTLHFDAVPASELERLPSYFGDCDLDSSHFVDSDGQRWVVPLWRGHFPTLATFRPEPGKVAVFQLERAQENHILELSVLERAAALLGASLTSGSSDFRVVPEGPTYRLAWSEEPGELLHMALRRLQSSARSQQ
jgi:hypothetical protein